MHQPRVPHHQRLRTPLPREFPITQKSSRPRDDWQPVYLPLFRLTGDDLEKLTTSSQLKFLTLVNNRISSMSYLQKLNKLSEL